MFERFTDRARRVVVLAQEEARMLNHNYIGTEHVLLGLVHEGDGIAAQALESLGVSLETVREQVEAVIGQGERPPTGHIPFTPRVKEVLFLALREASGLGHHYIGTEHLLLGLLREGEGVACQVLVQIGANLGRVRDEVIRLLEGYGEGALAAGADPSVASVGVRLTTADVRRDPESFPLCQRCDASLIDSLMFRVLSARGAQGDETRKALVMFCGICGAVVDAPIVSEDG